MTVSVEVALAEAIAEIEKSPYLTEAWGWGIAYRIRDWREALANVTNQSEDQETENAA